MFYCTNTFLAFNTFSRCQTIKSLRQFGSEQYYYECQTVTVDLTLFYIVYIYEFVMQSGCITLTVTVVEHTHEAE